MRHLYSSLTRSLHLRAAVVTPYLPWPADTGGKLRSYYLLKGLAERADIDLFTVCYGEPPDTAALEAFCRTVTVLPLHPTPHREQIVRAWLDGRPRSVRYFQDPQSLATIRQALTAKTYDLHICDEICMADYFAALPDSTVAADGQLPKRIVIRHKIDHLHYRETATSHGWTQQGILDSMEARRLQRYEAAMMPTFDGTVVCSAEDGAVASRQGAPIACDVVVNGADTDYFVPNRNPDPKPTVLLMGTMYYQPNIDGVLYFFENIYPDLLRRVSSLQVFIVGHTPPPEIVRLDKIPGVTVTGSVPDVRPYIDRSWVLAVPLRLGGGTRLKIVEAMAASLPVISTSVGAEGLPELGPETITLADTPDTFVTGLEQLLSDPARRARQAELARPIVQQQYSWQALGHKYAAFCCQLVADQN